MEKVNNDHRSENQKLQDFLPYSKKHRIFCRELLSNY